MKTIVALSTPIGGAIAIVRISGPLSEKIIEKLFSRSFVLPRHAYYCEADTGTIKDKCEVILYERGHSYTGEESAEIFCHGSAVIVREIIEFCIREGATLAERGEFTLTAYRNKKLDLSEAEGILDLINSETVEQAVNAYNSVDGKLKLKIVELQQRLKEIIAKVDVAIDYPEEDIEEVTKQQAIIMLDPLAEEISKLVKSFNDSFHIKHGIRVLICGKPNVGKSELFNALIGKNRAIVSEEEGTTRDFIESDYVYKGRKFLLIDTAGIRTTDSFAEKQGIMKMYNEAETANLILGVGTAQAEFEETFINKEKSDKILKVTNKCDIARGKNFNVSAKDLIGLDTLKEEIYKRTDFISDGLKIINIRQYHALSAARDHILSAIDCKSTLDCFASDLYSAYEEIGLVTGVIGSDEIIAEIFSRFCVGK